MNEQTNKPINDKSQQLGQSIFNSHLVVHSYKYIQLPFLTDAVRVVLIKHFQAASSRFTTELLKGHGDYMGGKIIFQCLCVLTKYLHSLKKLLGSLTKMFVTVRNFAFARKNC